MKTRFVPLMATAVLFIALLSCSKKDAESGKARLLVALTDAPGDFEVVNIDIKDVHINYSNETEKGWTSLGGTKAGNYDLLRLANGKDTLLSDAAIKTGRIQQIRLVLGENNFLIIDGEKHALKTPSAQQSGLKLKIAQEVSEGLTYKLLMDFDASRSIICAGKGKFILKPVIRTSLEAIGGSIRGHVLSATTATAIYALKGADTIAGTYALNGGYMLKGLEAGEYSLAFVPADHSYKQQKLTGINVSINTVTAVDTVRLVQ